MNQGADPLYAVVYILAAILSIFLIYILLRLLEIYMPRIIELFKRITPKLEREFDELMNTVWSFVPGTERWTKREQQHAQVVRHEVHHHYGPQYHHAEQAHHVSQTTNVTNSQTIKDSVYYTKGKEGMGGGAPHPGTGGVASAPQPPMAGVMGGPMLIGPCISCGNQLQAGWTVCPVCTRTIGSSGDSEHY
jgi:hypothetical protein